VIESLPVGEVCARSVGKPTKKSRDSRGLLKVLFGFELDQYQGRSLDDFLEYLQVLRADRAVDGAGNLNIREGK
jgi:hypothetical protein